MKGCLEISNQSIDYVSSFTDINIPFLHSMEKDTDLTIKISVYLLGNIFPRDQRPGRQASRNKTVKKTLRLSPIRSLLDVEPGKRF